MSDNGQQPEDPFNGVQRAMTELVMDRFVGPEGGDEEGAFHCVPMRVGENLVLCSFIVTQEIQHVTDDGITIIPGGSAVTFVLQEYLIGEGMENMEKAQDNAVALWPLGKIVEDK